MTDELDNLPDVELSAVFAVEVAGWKDSPIYPESHWITPVGKHVDKKLRLDFPFANSMDALMPWLDKMFFWECRFGPFGRKEPKFFSVSVSLVPGSMFYYSHAPTPARAACIAILRAKRAEKGGAS